MLLLIWLISSSFAACTEAPVFERETGDGLGYSDHQTFFRQMEKACDSSGKYSENVRRNGTIYAGRALKSMREDLKTDRDLGPLQQYLDSAQADVDGQSEFVYESPEELARPRGTPTTPAPSRPGLTLPGASYNERPKLRDWYQRANRMLDPSHYPMNDLEAELAQLDVQLGRLTEKVGSNADLSPLATYRDAVVQTARALEAEARAASVVADSFMEKIGEAKRGVPYDTRDPESSLAQTAAWKDSAMHISAERFAHLRQFTGDGLPEPTFRGSEGNAMNAFASYHRDMIDDAEQATENAKNQCVGWGAVNQMVCVAPILAKWEVAASVVDEAAVRSVRDQLKTLATVKPSLAAARAADKADAAQRLASVVMPGAVSSDPVAIAAGKQAFQRTGWNERLLAVSVQSPDWQMIRHPITGAVVARHRSVVIAAKQASGDCNKYDMTIRQDKSGSGWSAARRYSHNTAGILCKKVGG
ncbi:MAG: hypothetical protein AB8H79_05125 [Myxococcota bacterium]